MRCAEMHACKRQRWVFPPLFRAEGLFVFSPFRNIVLSFAPHPHLAIVGNMSIELNIMDNTTAESHPDSPAIPGRADATSISRSQTSPSGSHIPLPSQPEEIEIQAAVEAANEDVDEPGTTDRSILDLLKECIPKGSNSVLERVVHNRSPSAMVKLKSDSGSMQSDDWKSEAVWEQVDGLKSSEHIVLVIDDIDDEWCEAWCNRYPERSIKGFF